MVKVRMNIVPDSVAKKVTYGGTNSKKHIVIHETANTSKGANADAHARLQANGNSRQASWHYQVDDKEIVQSFSDNAQCWHAGNVFYNKNSIGIEICVNSDGNYKKAVKNAVELTRSLMSKYKIPKTNVIQHKNASGKDCPKYLRNGYKGIDWDDFKRMLDGKAPSKKTTKKSSKSISQMADEVVAGKHGSGHSNRRKSLGISESEYAKVRAEVNRRLTGKAPKKTSKSISQMADEVIRGKHGVGHDKRRKSLGIDKATYEKVRREVNRRLK